MMYPIATTPRMERYVGTFSIPFADAITKVFKLQAAWWHRQEVEDIFEYAHRPDVYPSRQYYPHVVSLHTGANRLTRVIKKEIESVILEGFARTPPETRVGRALMANLEGGKSYLSETVPRLALQCGFLARLGSPLAVVRLPVAIGTCEQAGGPYLDFKSLDYGVYWLSHKGDLGPRFYLHPLFPAEGQVPQELMVPGTNLCVGLQQVFRQSSQELVAVPIDGILEPNEPRRTVDITDYPGTKTPFVDLSEMPMMAAIRNSFNRILMTSKDEPYLPETHRLGYKDASEALKLLESMTQVASSLADLKRELRSVHRKAVAYQKQNLPAAEALVERERVINDEVIFSRKKLKALATRADSIKEPVVTALPEKLETYLTAHGVKILAIEGAENFMDSRVLDSLETYQVSEKRTHKAVAPAFGKLRTMSSGSSSSISALALSIERASNLRVYKKGGSVAEFQENKEVGSCFMYFKFGKKPTDKPLMKILPTVDDMRLYVKMMSYGATKSWPEDSSKVHPLAVYIHPHSAPLVKDTDALIQGVNLAEVLIPAGCLGEIQSPLAIAALRGDLLGLVSLVYSWYLSANEDDAWGKNWPAYSGPL
jgi:hypothetical protein